MPLLAFNAAVWWYRKPAHASRLAQSRDWLINRIVESASITLSSIKPPKRKQKKKFDTVTVALEHDSLVTDAKENTAICYTDGSASPNPGPSGAGASIFLRNPDTLVDLGASLGRGTNNTAELFALGAIFVELSKICAKNHAITSAVVFSDSKLALGAAASKKTPLTNSSITRALRLAFVEVSARIDVQLHWIHGHADIGGNERVDRISKRFASVPFNDVLMAFDPSFPSQVSSSCWNWGFPLCGLTLNLFTSLLPTPAVLPSQHVSCDFHIVNLPDSSTPRPHATRRSARVLIRNCRPLDDGGGLDYKHDNL